MNEQEMQFANPDWRPTAQPLAPQQPVDFYSDPTLPAEQDYTRDKQGSVYQQGYQAQQRQLAHYRVPGYRGIMGTRRRLWPWLVMTIALICLVPILLSAMAMVVGKSTTPTIPTQDVANNTHPWHGEQSAPDTGHVGSQLTMHAYSYDMAHISTVKIDDPTGSIHVHGNVFDAQSRIEALSDNAVPNPLQFIPSSDGTLTIKVNAPTDDNPVLLDMIVPHNIALILNTNGGNIEVDGINGQVNLRTASSLLLSNDTISGQSSITSEQGNVRIVNSTLSGTYVVTGEHGSLALQQVRLSGQGRIQAQAEASIVMVGMLDQQGNYTFASVNGEIDLALPSDSAIRLHLDPGTGSASSDFPTQANNGAPLTVKTEHGDILIRQGP